MIKPISKSQQVCAFLILVMLAVVIADSWRVFNYPPRSVHQWRQSDCAAYVKTYYRTNSSLLQPATYNLAGSEGRVVSEFPILYYISARLQKVTGEHYAVTRGLTFACYVIGLLALLACTNRWVERKGWAVFSVILLATSPYYYYYSINFLPNIPAISFSFVGLYFFLLYDKGGGLIWNIAGTLFFMLAAALKPTDGGIVWLAYVGAQVIMYIRGRGERSIPKAKLVALLTSSFLIAFSIWGWARFANHYNNANGNHQNLLGIYPIWDMEAGLRNYTLKRILTQWRNVFQHDLVLVVLLFMFIVYLLKWKMLDPFLRVFTFLLGMGAGIYGILWFKAFTDHDYYQLPFVLPAVFLSITVVAYISNNVVARTRNILGFVAVFLVGVGFYYNAQVQKNRYRGIESVNPALFTVEPYLLKMGVLPNDHVVCVPDKSPNISLNAINRYGYTEEFNNDAYNIYTFKRQGASYLIVSDTSYLSNPIYIPFMKRKIGSYKGISIFDIRGVW